MQQLLGPADAIRLREVLPNGRFIGVEDIPVRSCCSTWQECRPGDVYVALLGSDTDGHDHIHLAVQRGASAVVSERLPSTRIPCCVVPDTREAYGRICQRLAGQPDRALRLIGISGTHGKTTTAMLVTAILQAASRTVGIICSLGASDAQTACGELPSTPPPPELAGWLARMVAHGCSHAVVEVSSAALASRHIAGLEFDAAVLTNVRRDHLDLHGNATNYRRAKRRLFEHLKPGGFGVLNVDDSASCRIARDLSVPLITIGMHGDGELEARLLERCVSEQTFLMIAGEESVPVRTRTIGDEFIRCCLSAAAVGLVMGLDLMTIVRGLEAVEHVPGRLERLECGQPFGVFVDHAQTPNTLALSLRTMRQVTAGRVICVYGSPQWQASDQRAAIGSVAERGADIGIITSNDPGREAPLKIAHDILDGFRHPGRAHVIPDRAKAIQWALGEARPGDTVLITGKGDQSYQLIGERAVPFEDRDVARCWLHGSQPRLEKVGTRATIPFRPPHEWN